MEKNNFLESYSKFLQKFLKPQKPLKVVFDCSNGTAGLIIRQLKIANCKLEIINDNPDGNFPAHGPDPLKPGAVKQLQAAVQKNKADLGIIFDADGDRMFCIDDKSRFVNPDVIARLLTWQLKPKKIIVDVSSGWLIKRFKIQDSRFKILESKVGHYFIKKMMRAENADFGAEHSGHYYFKKFFGLDSGILAAIEVINAASQLPYKLSDFVELLPKYYRQGIDFKLNGKLKIKSENQQDFLERVENCYKIQVPRCKIQAVNHLDGLTMEFPNWWFNFRFSQTEPLVRLNIEATEQSKLQEEVLKLEKLIK